jgi:hypothetical protein
MAADFHLHAYQEHFYRVDDLAAVEALGGASKRSLAISDAYSNMGKRMNLRRTADRGKNLLRKPNNIVMLS